MSKKPKVASAPHWVRGSTGLKGLPRAVWEGAPAEWIAALQAIDQRQDLEPLRRLMMSEKPMSRAVRYHMLDLVERHVQRRPGPRQQPSYDMTMQNQRLDVALTEVLQRPRQMTAAAAIKKFAEQYGVDVGALTAAYNGRHRSLKDGLRRAKAGTAD